MRLILVEHGGECVRGDSALFASRSAEWAENTFQKVSVSKLAVIAARLLDESEGRFRLNYHFSSFGPFERGGGYDVFVCGEDADDSPPECFGEVSHVVCRCFYVGFVRCLKPVVPFDLNRRSSIAGKREEALERAGAKRARRGRLAG